MAFQPFRFLLLAIAVGHLIEWRVVSSCSVDADCSLNGVCDKATHVCVCDKPWHGDECEVVGFKPVTFPQGYGMVPNLTSWGAGVFFDDADKMYHMYASVMTNHCPLGDWTTNMRIDHSVSPVITGPYTFKDIAVPLFSTNPAPVRLPDGSYAIFHIGDGCGDAKEKNCTTSTELADSSTEVALRATECSPIHVSKSLNGPWAALLPNRFPGCNNPAPWVHSNGTIFVLCNNKQPNPLYRADDVKGPWTQVSSIHVAPDGPPTMHYEDPFLYIDHRDNWHVLFHAYDTNENRYNCVNSTVSSHMFSVDGHTWLHHPTQPYTTQVALSTGKTITVATRERPRVLWDKKGTMTHLINAVCSATACPPPHGPTTGCVDCKSAAWDYTLVAPLDT